MKVIQVIEEILSKVFKWYRFPVSLKAEAVSLYFKGLSLRAVREFLIAIWVHMDETKIKAKDRTYYPWSFGPLKTGN